MTAVDCLLSGGALLPKDGGGTAVEEALRIVGGGFLGIEPGGEIALTLIISIEVAAHAGGVGTLSSSWGVSTGGCCTSSSSPSSLNPMTTLDGDDVATCEEAMGVGG